MLWQKSYFNIEKLIWPGFLSEFIIWIRMLHFLNHKHHLQLWYSHDLCDPSSEKLSLYLLGMTSNQHCTQIESSSILIAIVLRVNYHIWSCPMIHAYVRHRGRLLSQLMWDYFARATGQTSMVSPTKCIIGE